MPFRATLVKNGTGVVDVRWSSSPSSMPTTSELVEQCYLVSVARDIVSTAADHEWTILVRDPRTSALRLELGQSGFVGTPAVTVMCCRVTRSELGDERWIVEAVDKSSTAVSPAGGGSDDGLERMFSGMSFSNCSPTTPSAAASGSIPVVRLRAPSQPSFGLGSSSRYGQQEVVNFVVEVYVHRETYRKAAVSWSYPGYHQKPDKWQVRLQNITSRAMLVQFVEGTVRRVEFSITLKAGNRYRVTVTALQLCSTPPFISCYQSIGIGQADFKAVLTLDDLTALRDKAKVYSQGNTFCRVLYRNKSPQYFSDVDKKAGIMTVYVKDNSGDQASPINGQIDGLFFMAGEPQIDSPFGSTRLTVPVDLVFNMTPRLYFADFYCMRGQYHYVTLVMTMPGSAADRFCRQHLLPLRVDDQTNNPFLFRRAGSAEMRVAHGVKVEVLFTENIDVNQFRRRGATITVNVPLVGRGSSTLGGLPKNPNCHVCNFQPLPYSDSL